MQVTKGTVFEAEGTAGLEERVQWCEVLEEA